MRHTIGNSLHDGRSAVKWLVMLLTKVVLAWLAAVLVVMALLLVLGVAGRLA